MKRRTLKNMPCNIYVTVTDQDNNRLFLLKNHFGEYVLVNKYTKNNNFIRFNSEETASNWITHNIQYFQHVIDKFQSYVVETTYIDD